MSFHCPKSNKGKRYPMSLLRNICLLSILGSGTFSFATSIPKSILPDNVVVCESSAGCVNKTLFGRTYKVITTPRFTVMVSVSREGVYTRADVSIANNSGLPLSLSPDDFRVEVVTPKPKVLLYVAPSNLKDLPTSPSLEAAPDPAPQAPAPTSDTEAKPAAPAPDIDALYAAAKKRDAEQEKAEKIAAEKPLMASSIAPNEVTRGRVYFERDKKAQLVNVVLPIAGLVFQFPYELK
jgi:pyruvate/2-oxoglutarate dehydrogenase complex dihydrolipoamide acyltransferase (E2) component